MARILLIDDDASLREVLSFALREMGHEVSAHGDGAHALATLREGTSELVVTDLKMPGMDGMEVLRRVRAFDSTIPVVILTAFGTIGDAVEAMKEGASHYLTKPYNREELRITIDQVLERRRLLLENQSLRERLRAHLETIELIHASPAMDEVYEIVRRVAPSDATVLITGESGSGKEVVARSVHAHSDRWDGPFVAVNCAAIPRDLMESELFGHARGAFTGAVKDKPGKFEQAEGGTLLLDEIGDLSAELQAKLLRVLETREVDVVGGRQPIAVDARIIAATNADLSARVQERQFRSDLFYRLNVIPIRVPPLRERLEDIPALWQHFVTKFAPEADVRTSPELLDMLMARRWPGNVRELANTCQRMVILRRSDVLTPNVLPREEEGMIRMPSDPGPSSTSPSATSPPSAGESADAPRPVDQGSRASFLGELPESGLPLREVEREIIVRALEKHGGNRSRTAEYLEIPRHVLLYRMVKFGIE
ncbi:MAG: sigma-54-dependent Fis family transcriptional regulator [Candidatus Eisenbacteria bacterium]|uniref:Sigma-54-dependent Fis family transcriptional regulator n=1 Tax=Eiseniibacteriota bacterium TaxID=2212470 RepID=A0A956NCB5_UNCEI|nr:sigma-54-dependent Fis family transcriptional regulator [Candidatus Eisenbacteria bacterium]